MAPRRCGPYTKLMREACDVLNVDVHRWHALMRQNPRVTWRDLADELNAQGVSVKPETLRRWSYWYRKGN